MCDYSLHSVKSRPAKVGDKLTTHDFGTGTRGFAASEDVNVAVCVLPGTELSFAEEVRCLPTGLIAWRDKIIEHKTAIFRQINKDRVVAHHDALEFPDGQLVLLTCLSESQQATVLQLPAEPKTVVEVRSPAAGSLRRLNFHTMAALIEGGHFSIRSSKQSIRERCHANLHLAWSVHFRCRQRHAG